ncbi:hypothetical protein BD779DRAFT_1608762 [Infundibulicybe gibba]|nr:hypothetical protein BD779DRAFT_1608762 [Infundibulicybe gibba]
MQGVLAPLYRLPIELLYEIQLYACSDSFPLLSRYIYDIFTSTPISFRAQYMIGRILSYHTCDIRSDRARWFSKALSYPLCSKDVIVQIIASHSLEPWEKRLDNNRLHATYWCSLPRRLFRPVLPKTGSEAWSDDDEPLPFLRYLTTDSRIPPLNVNAHDGYALTKAVNAQFIPLVRFLLSHNASPACKDHLAIMVAIQRKDLPLVKLLIEPKYLDEHKPPKGKRRKLEDRVEVKRSMLRAAVKCGAWDIAQYMRREKHCIPDISTLEMIVKSDGGWI